jgi:hypothetical protein
MMYRPAPDVNRAIDSVRGFATEGEIPACLIDQKSRVYPAVQPPSTTRMWPFM